MKKQHGHGRILLHIDYLTSMGVTFSDSLKPKAIFFKSFIKYASHGGDLKKYRQTMLLRHGGRKVSLSLHSLAPLD